MLGAQLGWQCVEGAILPQHDRGQHVDIIAQTCDLGDDPMLLVNEESQIRMSARISHERSFARGRLFL
jgi:hypothetical protein